MAACGAWTGGGCWSRPNPPLGHAAFQVQCPRHGAHHSLGSPAVGDANDRPSGGFLKVLGEMLLEPANPDVHVDTMR
jgi:hypothetical protein